MEKKVYTVSEVAEMLSLGNCKIYDLIHEKKIPSIKVGRKFIIPKKRLEEWLESESF